MDKTQEWTIRRDAWIAKSYQLQTAIIAEIGALDMREYRRRLEECGLMAEWNALQANQERHKKIFGRERSMDPMNELLLRAAREKSRLPDMLEYSPRVTEEEVRRENIV